MNNLFNRSSTPEAAAIRERIFNVLPAASYQMEKLFGLVRYRVQHGDGNCRRGVPHDTPLLLNKGFLDKYCQATRTFSALLHELYTSSSDTPGSSPIRADRQHPSMTR